MYDVESGQILLDGQDITSLNLHQLRQKIGYVPQDAFLFSDTIEKNIAFGEPDATSDHIKEITKNAAIYDLSLIHI